MDIDNDRIEVYHSNIYNLYEKIQEEYGEYLEPDKEIEEADVDLPNILLSTDNIRMHKRDFQKIYLFFDYERQDSFYSSLKITNMMQIFNDETNNGRLYINYPMVESYLDMDSWNENGYLNKFIQSSLSRGKLYKNTVMKNWVEYDTTVFIKVVEKISHCLKEIPKDMRKEIICAEYQCFAYS